jgi:hypothetical protein
MKELNLILLKNGNAENANLEKYVSQIILLNFILNKELR